MMTQCFYLPRYYSKLIRDYYEIWGKKETEPNGYDICIGDFIRKYIRKYYIHCPSLVQHRQDKSRIDLRRSTKRQSKTFIDPDYD